MANDLLSSSGGSGAGGGEIKLTANEFRQISDLAYQRFGLDLKRGKEALVAARLGKKLRKLGFQTFAEYHRHILADSTGDALIELIDALTTNHTSFLRERAHFEFLARAANEELREASPLRVWSAACSSAKSLIPSPCVWGGFGASRPRASSAILATDISTRVLEAARRGVYPAGRFDDVPEPLRRAYLLRGRGESEGFYRVKPELAKRIEFDRFNLIEPFSAARAVPCHLLPQRDDVFRQAHATGHRPEIERLPGAGRLSFCRSFRVAHRRATCFGICAAGHLSQPEAARRGEALALKSMAVKKAWR